VTAVSPRAFSDQLRDARFEATPEDLCQIRPVDVHLSSQPHVFFWGRGIRSILREPWNIVHIWDEPYCFGGIQPALLTPRETPFVFATFQNIAKRYPPPFGSLERAVLRRSKGWIAYGETIARAQADRYGYGNRPMAMIPPGVDVDLFRPDAGRGADVRNKLGWDTEGPPVIGYVGRFVPEKGLAAMMHTLDALKAPWRALLVGTGPMKEELEAWTQRQGGRAVLATQVRHHEVPAYLNAMDMLVVPSLTKKNWREQFGRMVTEAFASGVPVISSDSGELPFTVGDAGVIVPEGDRDAWRRSVEELVTSSERRSDLAARGRRRAVEHFAWPVVARRTLEFLAQFAG
jgi:glycosyltransferase involved in cell wall biosynthesis